MFSKQLYTDVDPVFLIGAPRSGTTLTFQVLAHVMQVGYLPRVLDYGYGLTHFFFRLMGSQLRQPAPVYTSVRGATPGWLSPSEGFGFWRQWFLGVQDDRPVQALSASGVASLRRAVYAVQGQMQAPLLVKSLYLSLAVPALASAFPKARFIHVVRDPLDVAVSLFKVRQALPSMDWWGIRPPGYQQHLAEPLIDQVVWQIAETRRLIQQDLATLAASQFEVLEYEDLCAAPAQVVDRLAAWLEPAGCHRREQCVLPKLFPVSRGSADEAGIIRQVKQSAYYERLGGVL